MSRARARRKLQTRGKTITALHNISDILQKDSRFRHVHRTSQPQSFTEKNRLFSEAGRAVVSCLLNGKMKIHRHDVQLDALAADGNAILIDERISSTPEFQKMWAETSCQEILTTLAQKALQG